MKRILTALLTLCMVFALALPALATDVPNSTTESGDNSDDTARSDVAVVAYTVTDLAGGEVTTVKKGDHINVVLKIADYSAYGAKVLEKGEHRENDKYRDIQASDISARLNSTDFTYNGIGEIGDFAIIGDGYLSYNLLFRDVVYNGTSQTLPIVLSYVDTSLPFQSVSLKLGQCIVSDDKEAKAGLMVRTVNYDDVVTAGQAFTLNLGIYATDGSQNLEDVVVTLTPPGNVSLEGGSWTYYIGTMAPKTTKNVSFRLVPSAGFTDTLAEFSVNVSATGGTSANSTISVPVTQPDRFEVGQLEMQDTVNVGDTASVTLSYVNKGKRELGNLEARLTGTNIGSESYQYLGNLNAGSEGSVDFDITPDAAGTISGVITLTYEDANGKIQTVSKDFTATAEEYSDPWGGMDPGMEEPMPEEPQQTGLPVWGWVLIVLGGAAVVVVIVVVVRKRKKAKALANLEAEDNDEDI